MNRREWSQADLARYSDLNRAVINKLLNGQSMPRPSTLEGIARAFRTPVEKVFRIAGLLPEISETDGFNEEVLHNINQIQDPKRKSTALLLIKALIQEEETEKVKNDRRKSSED
ncbi:MAG: helix-turn-helix transcriptional regulator [Anaerolineales bacterium]|nr:helix-turn-helix transcriptional regulator [Anaerolineales bacterium]MCB9110250.1 helix-turn-helix transcriptional regulator [Anaerolineales bacterium]